MSNKDLDHRPMFATGSAANGDTVIVIGIPQSAIDDMLKTPGFGCSIDLSRAGVPLVITMFAGKDHAHCKEIIMGIARELGIPAKLDMSKDFSIRDRRN